MHTRDFAILGKHAAEADFHRQDVHDASEMAFFRWLVEAHGLAASHGHPLDRTLGFAFHDADAGRAPRWVVGVMVPSQDAVGRRFPLAATRALPEREVGQAFAAIPEAWHAPLVAVREALGQPLRRDDDLALPAPASLFSAWSAAAARHEGARLADLHARLFDGDEDAAAYAYATLRAPRGPGPRVLVCPLAGAADDAFHWLELTRRAHGRPALFAWTGGRAPCRLLIGLGTASPWTLTALSRPELEPSLIWPLETTSAAARAQARAGLGPRWPTPTQPVSALFEAMLRDP